MPDPGDAAVNETILADLLESTGGDREFLAELIETFLDDAPRHVAAMRQAAMAGRAEDVVRPAHTLKGTSASLGATGLSERSRVLELAARAGDLDDADGRIEAIESELARVAVVLGPLRTPEP